MTEEKRQPEPPDVPETPPASTEQPGATKKLKWIPLQRVPQVDELLAEELEEIYDEDKVTHRHGSSEPEGD